MASEIVCKECHTLLYSPPRARYIRCLCGTILDPRKILDIPSALVKCGGCELILEYPGCADTILCKCGSLLRPRKQFEPPKSPRSKVPGAAIARGGISSRSGAPRSGPPSKQSRMTPSPKPDPSQPLRRTGSISSNRRRGPPPHRNTLKKPSSMPKKAPAAMYKPPEGDWGTSPLGRKIPSPPIRKAPFPPSETDVSPLPPTKNKTPSQSPIPSPRRGISNQPTATSAPTETIPQITGHKEGWLVKRGHNFQKDWRQRFFTYDFNNGLPILKYFDTKPSHLTPAKLKGSIELEECNVIRMTKGKISKEYDFIFCIKQPVKGGKKVKLTYCAATSQSDLDLWVSLLSQKK